VQAPSTLLDASVRISVLEPLRTVNAALLELLRSFTTEDWHRPTIHPDRNVKELTAHLLQTTLNRISIARDGYLVPPEKPVADLADLIAMIQETNRRFMTATRWVSPRILMELLETYDQELVSVFERLEPDAYGLGVAWAGEVVSRNWFDIAREYTEKWHHQQQLRDATGRQPLYQSALLTPVLETFARGLPFAFRSQRPRDGTSVAVSVTGPVDLDWTVRRIGGAWSLWSGTDPTAETRVSLSADTAWRVWTKGMSPAAARASMRISGEATLAEPVAHFVAIMA
jgi:uncharacterized protein (TIGR03083 family)